MGVLLDDNLRAALFVEVLLKALFQVLDADIFQNLHIVENIFLMQQHPCRKGSDAVYGVEDIRIGTDHGFLDSLHIDFTVHKKVLVVFDHFDVVIDDGHGLQWLLGFPTDEDFAMVGFKADFRGETVVDVAIVEVGFIKG